MPVQDYLDNHMLSRKIEDVVNAAVRAKASDPVLFISNRMKKVVPSVITKVKARQILDSRGIPTVEVDLHTNKGMFRASAPSSDASGMYEAIELRDGDKGLYLGNSVSKAVKNVNEKISEALVGMDPALQSQIDKAMMDLDKTEKKSELGVNAILAVSIAACKAGAAQKEVPLYKHIADLSGNGHLTLPVPAFTVISGGKRAGNNLAIQEIMILPIGASKFEEALQMGSETYHHLKAVITEKYGAHGCNVGEDGGFAPNISSVIEVLDLVKEAISRTDYNDRIKLAIDVAATDFCIGTKYDLDYKSADKGQNFKSADDMIGMYIELCGAVFGVSEYPIVSVEDPFDKEDWEHTKRFSSLGICQVVGDDLITSNPKRIKRAIEESTCNALLIKINQIGTVTETIFNATSLGSVKEVLDLVKEAISRTDYNDQIKLAIDVAATDFCIGTKYDLDYKSVDKGQNFKSADDMIGMYEELCSEYPIVSVEDPFDKEDWEHTKRFSSLGICQVVGDDLITSSPKRIKRAIEESTCNALLVKINQIGTVTETIEVMKLAKDAHWGVVVSHRCGETEDSFIADLAVGLSTGQIKAGAPCRGERLAKYNQLLRIEEELGDNAFYAGEEWRQSP